MHDRDDTAAEEIRYTGHSRQLRARLRAARIERGMTLQNVADGIAQRLERESLTAAAVSSWETFVRHPAIDVMAAWARVVGLRLVVDLDDAKGERIPVLLHPRTADIAREIDAAPEADREMIRQFVERLTRR
jgi:transcriptional regulator with XRE-family HTH domain